MLNPAGQALPGEVSYTIAGRRNIHLRTTGADKQLEVDKKCEGYHCVHGEEAESVPGS